jgi:hypothetical protein
MSTRRVGDSHDWTLSSTFLGPSRAPCRYVKMERIVLYDRARPCTSREVVLGDELTCRLNQNLDDFERATSDRDRYSMRSQFTPSEIELPLARLVHQLSALRALAAPVQDFSRFIRNLRRAKELRQRLGST